MEGSFNSRFLAFGGFLMSLQLVVCCAGLCLTQISDAGWQPTSSEMTISKIPSTTVEERLEAVESRLEDLESQLAAIRQHLGFVEMPKIIDPQKPRAPGGEVAISRLDRMDRRLAKLEGGATESTGNPPLVPVPAGTSATPLCGMRVLINLTVFDRYITVNDRVYRAPRGRTEIWVPFALVEVYARNWELPKLWGMSNWKWNGRHYEMVIEIRPR